jgi:hypothetical protein
MSPAGYEGGATVVASPRPRLVLSDALPSLHTPPCSKLGGETKLQRLLQRPVPSPAPPGVPPTSGSKSIESSLRRPPVAAGMLPPSPRHRSSPSSPVDFDVASPNGAYPQTNRCSMVAVAGELAMSGSLTPRAPSVDAPRGASRRPNASSHSNSHRTPSSDGSAYGSLRATLPAVPLTARDNMLCVEQASVQEIIALSHGLHSARTRSSSRSSGSRQVPCGPAKEEHSRRVSSNHSAKRTYSIDAVIDSRQASPRLPSQQEDSYELLNIAANACSVLSQSPSGTLVLQNASADSSKEPEGGSIGFRNILEGMNRDREIWESKISSLVCTAGIENDASTESGTGSSPVPPSSAQSQAKHASSSSRPCSARAKQLKTEESVGSFQSPSESTSADSLIDTLGLPGNVDNSSDGSRVLDDVDLGESLIATALKEAGLDPALMESSELMVADIEPSTSLSSTRSGDSHWASASKGWAAERLRRKRESALRSSAGTPADSC